MWRYRWVGAVAAVAPGTVVNRGGTITVHLDDAAAASYTPC